MMMSSERKEDMSKLNEFKEHKQLNEIRKVIQRDKIEEFSRDIGVLKMNQFEILKMKMSIGQNKKLRENLTNKIDQMELNSRS